MKFNIASDIQFIKTLTSKIAITVTTRNASFYLEMTSHAEKSCKSRACKTREIFPL